MLIVCILAMRLHTSGYDDLLRMMLASSSWNLTTRRTRRLHGAKMSVIGMIQTPNPNISIAALWRALNFCGFGFLHRTTLVSVFPMVACIYKLPWKTCFALCAICMLNYWLSSSQHCSPLTYLCIL
ncbi:Anaphase-promoting complex subunit 8 [Zea mays]|jgi:hypothetical protein|uniref:Anaphase-promoting complex subunit 8 n=1 Tax=Zea mays TaxID=4577 RepID=A0A1D6HF17_MAIZE|nr:Anaphase-promoting complex subunit 8 [Zea mays]